MYFPDELYERWRKFANTCRVASRARGKAQAGRREGAKRPARGAAKSPRKRRPRTMPTERELQALELRRQRWTFAQIGAELGFTKQRAQQLVKAALGREPATHGRSVKTQALLSDHRGQPLIEERHDADSA